MDVDIADPQYLNFAERYFALWPDARVIVLEGHEAERVKLETLTGLHLRPIAETLEPLMDRTGWMPYIKETPLQVELQGEYLSTRCMTWLFHECAVPRLSSGGGQWNGPLLMALLTGFFPIFTLSELEQIITNDDDDALRSIPPVFIDPSVEIDAYAPPTADIFASMAAEWIGHEAVLQLDMTTAERALIHDLELKLHQLPECIDPLPSDRELFRRLVSELFGRWQRLPPGPKRFVGSRQLDYRLQLAASSLRVMHVILNAIVDKRGPLNWNSVTPYAALRYGNARPPVISAGDPDTFEFEEMTAFESIQIAQSIDFYAAHTLIYILLQWILLNEERHTPQRPVKLHVNNSLRARHVPFTNKGDIHTKEKVLERGRFLALSQLFVRLPDAPIGLDPTARRPRYRACRLISIAADTKERRNTASPSGLRRLTPREQSYYFHVAPGDWFSLSDKPLASALRKLGDLMTSDIGAWRDKSKKQLDGVRVMAFRLALPILFSPRRYRKVSEWYSLAGLKKPTSQSHPDARGREPLEDALDFLKHVGLITEWTYSKSLPDCKIWLTTWLAAKIRIVP